VLGLLNDVSNTLLKTLLTQEYASCKYLNMGHE